jgi:hypothetical protein
MKESLIGHEIPATMAASKLLWKSPWWAKAPAEMRRKSSEIARSMKIEEMVEVTKSPPATITDRRGSTIQWKCGKIGIVTGFAFTKERRKNLSVRAKLRTRPPYWVGEWDDGIKRTRLEKIHYWWAFADGEYFTIKWDHASRRRFSILKDGHE